jgi:uncharacterized protein (DUF983 family)
VLDRATTRAARGRRLRQGCDTNSGCSTCGSNTSKSTEPARQHEQIIRFVTQILIGRRMMTTATLKVAVFR